MQLTTNMLNNKIDLSKMNTQFTSGSVAPDDLSAADTYGKTNDQLSTEEKVDKVIDAKIKLDVARAFLTSLGNTIEFAVQCANGSMTTEAMFAYAVDSKVKMAFLDEKVKVMKATEQVMKEHPTLAVKSAVTETRRDDRKEERKESSYTIENGQLCYNGSPVSDGTVRDSDKSVFTLGFGTDENGMSSKLSSLLGDITADISGGDMSNMKAYLEELSAYKDSLQSIQADLEHEDPAVAITKYKEQEATYQACLAMQPNIFQPTLSDYVS